ncbi:MAG: hypothetical protein ACREQN_09815 [Candidatus Binataceae bacterium]
MLTSAKTRFALVAAVVALAGLLAAAPAFSLDLSHLLGGSSTEHDNFKIIHVAQLKALMADKQTHVYVYDANPPDVRAESGVIPEAKLLSSSSHYDVATTLPPNKDSKLVFYCHNTL